MTINSNFTCKKRKISDNELLYDLEKSFDQMNKKQKLSLPYTLQHMGNNLFSGKFYFKFNLDNLAEFIDVEYDNIKYIESKYFIRNNNFDKTLKKNMNDSFNYVKLHISLGVYIIHLQLFPNGIFLIKNCSNIVYAEDAIEKLLFKINNDKFKNLYYL